MSEALGPPISFFCPPLLLPPVPLHSWKGSNAVRRQTQPRLSCRFYQRAKMKGATHVRECIQTGRRSACLSAIEGGGLMHRRAKVKAHTVLEAIKQWAFPSASSLRHFISSASTRDWRTDNFSRLHTNVLVCFWRSQCRHRKTRWNRESVFLSSLKSSFSPSWKI